MRDTEDQIELDDEEAFEREVNVSLVRQVPIGLIFARIIVVSGMSFAAAGAIFCAIGAIWVPALICVGVTLLFMFLMFFIERGAGSRTAARS
jgi:Na+/serine symporter